MYTKLKAIFLQRNGDFKMWITFAIYVWFVLLALLIALELAR